MKRLATALFAFLFVASAWAGGVPNLPNQASFGDPSQILSTLQTLINQLNGAGIGTGGYTTPQIMSLGQFCLASGASGITCNGQRGTFTTNSLSTAAGAVTNFVVNDSIVTSGSNCRATLIAYSGTFSTNGVPIINGTTVAAGQFTVAIGNAGSNALSGTVGLLFDCLQ